MNTGDFVNYSYPEYESNDTILVKAVAKLGQYAVLGNHDMGTYNSNLNAAGRDSNVKMMIRLMTASGYRVLVDENLVILVGKAKIGLAGVTTRGRHPDIIHGDLGKAIAGLDSVDVKILLSHDPNHWELAVKGKTDIDLMLAGHTHGMQMGIITSSFKWSPAKYFYPEWNGLYNDDGQYLYVNRGLGVLGIPFRIGMPPEISVLRLTKK